MVLAIALVLGRYLISNELLLLWSPDPETRLYLSSTVQTLIFINLAKVAVDLVSVGPWFVYMPFRIAPG